MARDPGGLFTFLIIVVMMSIGIIKNVMEQKARKRGLGRIPDPDRDGDWQEWESPTGRVPAAATPSPRPVATPSSRVQDLLSALEEVQRKQTAARAAPPPQPVPAPAAVEEPPARVQPKTRRYLSGEQPESVGDFDEGAQPSGKTPQRFVTQSMSAAFPEAMRLVRKQRAGKRPPILLRGIGRESVRRAIVMSEILGRARAFDL